MFTIDEILKLSSAGFTAEQITALAGMGTPNAEPKAEPPKEEHKAEPPKVEPTAPNIADLMKQISDLSAQVQNAVIKQSAQPPVKTTSAEDALSDIFYRYDNKKGE